MLELEKLQFSGIGRFVEEQLIDFSTLNNFIQIDAENKNTGGSSGSGKTTVFNALDYILGVNNLPVTILQSRLTKSAINCTAFFKNNGRSLIISRSKSGLRIDDDGVITEGNSQKTEEKLDQILGMPREIFRKTFHKRQKEGGFFLDFTPKKMHEFLADCQNLGEFKKKQEEIDKNITASNELLNAYKSKLASNEMGLKTTKESIISLGGAPIKEVSREVILELKEKFDRSTIRFKDVSERSEKEARALEQERPNIDVVLYSGDARAGLEGRRKEIEAKIKECHASEQSRREKIRTSIYEKSGERNKIIAEIDKGGKSKIEATKIASEIKQIRDQKCPTCDQHWGTDSSKNVEQNKIAELLRHKDIISNASVAAQMKVEMDQELEELQNSLNPIVDPKLQELEAQLKDIENLIVEEAKKSEQFNATQNAVNGSILNEYYKKQESLRSKNNLEIEQARGQLDIDRRMFDIAINKLKSYEDAKVRYENSYNILNKKQEEFTKYIIECKNEIESTLKCIFYAEELKKAIKMYISYSFDDALEYIGDGATKIIRCIPNMSNATIQFEGTKETSEGKIKEEVNAVISMDGEIGIPIKSLSGGERSAVDLAVDLAVIDFIESRTGEGINVIVLDEPFDGLGTIEIEMALEVLKNSNTNKKIIIVDHNPEIKEMVESRLVVVREGLTSSIMQS